MTGIGLPVPPGFTITTAVCDEYYRCGEDLPAGLMDEVKRNVRVLEKELDKKFGDNVNPLLSGKREVRRQRVIRRGSVLVKASLAVPFSN